VSGGTPGAVDPDPDLPPPTVSPDAYDAAYFRETCIGADTWSESAGASVGGIYYGFLRRAQLRPGEVVVDLGTGRGDLLAAAIGEGAARAFGIEYSAAATELAAQTLRAHGIEDRAQVFLADARAVPLEDETADLVCMLEVAEHLSGQELHLALTQARRLLKPGGRLVIHTMPNRLIYTVTYRALRFVVGRSWPSEPRGELERVMHVNELTIRELRRAIEGAGMRAEVRLGEWIYTDFVPSPAAARVYKLLARIRPLAQFGIADIWAVGRR
jgi:cyclopropane fatty-acyl-phospholipid synthase-like methyltransferase